VSEWFREKINSKKKTEKKLIPKPREAKVRTPWVFAKTEKVLASEILDSIICRKNEERTEKREKKAEKRERKSHCQSRKHLVRFQCDYNDDDPASFVVYHEAGGSSLGGIL